MIKIMFICHGNICRSPMCEFILKDMTKKLGISEDFQIESSATSREEIGNDMYPKAKEKLREKKVSFTKHSARQFTKADYEAFDHIIIMERYNFVNLCRIIDEEQIDKVNLLLDFAGENNNDIADPWYTGNFEKTYNDIVRGCKGLLQKLGYSVD